MFEKMTGNVFQKDGQCFPKLWAIFFGTTSHVFWNYKPCFLCRKAAATREKKYHAVKRLSRLARTIFSPENGSRGSREDFAEWEWRFKKKRLSLRFHYWSYSDVSMLLLLQSVYLFMDHFWPRVSASPCPGLRSRWAFSPWLGFDFISVVMRLKWGCEGHFDPERVAPC